MPSNEIMSMKGQLVGMPLAGPESFSEQQLTYLKRALGVDETVLFTASGSGAASGTVSEAYTNFERIRIEVGIGNQAGDDGCTFVEISTRFPKMWLMYGMGGGGVNAYYCASKFVFSDTTTWSVTNGSSILHADTSTTVTGNTQYNANIKTCVWKMIGIHRISGGN